MVEKIGISERNNEYSGMTSPIKFKGEPFLLQMEITSVDELVEHQAFKCETIC